MPSDRMAPTGTQPESAAARALAALGRSITAYRSVVIAAAERARALRGANGGAERARLELGAFGGAWIDAGRFAELSQPSGLDRLAQARLVRAAAVLDEIAAAADATLFAIDVQSGDSLRSAIARAYARLGRGFGAATAVELVRTGRYDAERHDGLTDSFPFAFWSRADRLHAPPLVVSVDGADLRAGALAEFVDGTVRLILLVRGPAAPAPLVRAITPGTYVAQLSPNGSLERAAACEGPAIVALFEGTQDVAAFVHDPANGRASWQRLTIDRRPAVEPKRSIAGVSPTQQREELRQLEALAEPPALPTAPVESLVASGSADPTERLTAWLLAESGLARGAGANGDGSSTAGG